jgi:hypothetical protein
MRKKSRSSGLGGPGTEGSRDILELKLLAALQEEAHEMRAEDWETLRARVVARPARASTPGLRLKRKAS